MNKLRIFQGTAGIMGCAILFLAVQSLRAQATAVSEDKKCLAQMEEIRLAIKNYRNDHNGELPRALIGNPHVPDKYCLYPKYIKSISVFVCDTDAKSKLAYLGGTWPKDAPTYKYSVRPWVRNFPGDTFTSADFYSRIVPAHKDSLRLLECPYHGGPRRARYIGWDNEIHVGTVYFDPYFGEGERDSRVKKLNDDIRKRGGVPVTD